MSLPAEVFSRGQIRETNRGGTAARRSSSARERWARHFFFFLFSEQLFPRWAADENALKHFARFQRLHGVAGIRNRGVRDCGHCGSSLGQWAPWPHPDGVSTGDVPACIDGPQRARVGGNDHQNSVVVGTCRQPTWKAGSLRQSQRAREGAGLRRLETRLRSPFRRDKGYPAPPGNFSRGSTSTMPCATRPAVRQNFRDGRYTKLLTHRRRPDPERMSPTLTLPGPGEESPKGDAALRLVPEQPEW